MGRAFYIGKNPKERDRTADKRILRLIPETSEGIRMKDLLEKADLSPRTVVKHLERNINEKNIEKIIVSHKEVYYRRTRRGKYELMGLEIKNKIFNDFTNWLKTWTEEDFLHWKKTAPKQLMEAIEKRDQKMIMEISEKFFGPFRESLRAMNRTLFQFLLEKEEKANFVIGVREDGAYYIIPISFLEKHRFHPIHIYYEGLVE